MSTTINPNKALWEKGDFTQIAASMRESGEGLVATLGITEGLEVLDPAAATDNGVEAARLGANVLGVDTPATRGGGNARAQGLGLTNCRFKKARVRSKRARG